MKRLKSIFKRNKHKDSPASQSAQPVTSSQPAQAIQTPQAPPEQQKPVQNNADAYPAQSSQPTDPARAESATATGATGGSNQDPAPSPLPPPAAEEPSQPTSGPATGGSAQDAPQDLVDVDAASGTLTVALRNDTTSSTVYAYITGRAIDRGNALFLLQSDARTPYYPSSPSDIQQPLQANVAIALGAPGNTVNALIPHIAGGRIWFSIGTPLTFKLNPGPALVEPSVTNSSDPNINIDWAFAEFTYNSDQLYANISYVDFVSLPVSLQLDTYNSGTQTVTGMRTTGLQTIADDLRAQHATDNQGWDQLIVNRPGTNSPLRILSPNLGQVINPSLLSNYYDYYISQVYTKYTNAVLTVDTQSGFGVVNSTPGDPNTLMIGTQPFARPSTHDVWTCSTGPFATGSDVQRNAIIPRLAAAFNRSTLLNSSVIPASSDLYYKEIVTNHYSRIVHSVNIDGKGYAFPYDDVQASGAADQSGEVHAGDPKLFTVAIGGSRA